MAENQGGASHQGGHTTYTETIEYANNPEFTGNERTKKSVLMGSLSLSIGIFLLFVSLKDMGQITDHNIDRTKPVDEVDSHVPHHSHEVEHEIEISPVYDPSSQFVNNIKAAPVNHGILSFIIFILPFVSGVGFIYLGFSGLWPNFALYGTISLFADSARETVCEFQQWTADRCRGKSVFPHGRLSIKIEESFETARKTVSRRTSWITQFSSTCRKSYRSKNNDGNESLLERDDDTRTCTIEINSSNLSVDKPLPDQNRRKTVHFNDEPKDAELIRKNGSTSTNKSI